MSEGREVVFGTLNGCPVRCTRRLAHQLGVRFSEPETPATVDIDLTQTGAKPDTESGAKPAPADVRVWALEAGVDCPAKGRIPTAVMDAYLHAHE